MDTTTMYGLRESDSLIVSRKQPNKADMRKSATEVVEKRGLTKGNRLIKPQSGLRAGLLCTMRSIMYGSFIYTSDLR